jgi:glycosyltransferase involved in cell wall biosynthesis
MRTDFPETKVIETSMVLDGQDIFGRLARRSGLRTRLIERLLEKHQVPVLSHSLFNSAQLSRTATIGWIPDFQHIHLPEFFGTGEIESRNTNYRILSESCSIVILSSHAAKADFTRFAPEHASKAVVLQFVASPTCTNGGPTLTQLQQKYSFDIPFFVLPNQFWAHKNHRLVVSALQILKRKREPVLVLATGSAGDYRNPKAYIELMEFAKQCDVLEFFRVLGEISYDELVALMQNAIAIINPSRFEGWSTSVEEAKSLGKSVLLSDIPVHREQAPQLGSYFNVDDAEELASTLHSSAKNYDPANDRLNQQRARSLLRTRQLGFAETYRKIVLRALNTSLRIVLR